MVVYVVAAACVLALAGAATCSTGMDCSLNGVCSASQCDCDPGWHGVACQFLSIGAAPPGGMYGYGEPFQTTSWGGNAIWDNATGVPLWHLFAAEIAGAGCGLHAWQGQSTVVHATARSPMGPYKREGIAVPHQAHNPQAIVVNGSWYVFHIGSGNSRSEVKSCNETLPPARTGTAVATAPLDSPLAGQCPAAPPGFGRSDASCISKAPCASAHCNCGSDSLALGDCRGGIVGGDVPKCVASGAASCAAASGCHGFAVRTSRCAAGTAVRWQTYREGAAAADTVANADWTAYTTAAGAPTPPPAPPTPPVPPPPPPPVPGSALHVAPVPGGPFRPVAAPGGPAGCNNPSPFVHPNGTVLLACTWTLRRALGAFPGGGWSDPLPLRPDDHVTPNGHWEGERNAARAWLQQQHQRRYG
jgi:hypothetical protein